MFLTFLIGCDDDKNNLSKVFECCVNIFAVITFHRINCICAMKTLLFFFIAVKIIFNVKQKNKIDHNQMLLMT